MTDNNTALKKAGLKVTLPRLKILEVLQNPECHHVSAEDLYKKLIDMGEEIGLATVYRVLNQFDDAGIVTCDNRIKNPRTGRGKFTTLNTTIAAALLYSTSLASHLHSQHYPTRRHADEQQSLVRY